MKLLGRSHWQLAEVVGSVFLLMLCGYWCAVAPVVSLADTKAYLEVSELSLGSLSFWAHHDKPFLLPLFMKFLSPRALVIFQGLFHALVVLILAIQVRRLVSSEKFKPIAFFVVLGFGAAYDFLSWNNILMTESLTNSTFILFTAVTLFWMTSSKTFWPNLCLLGSAVLFCAIRDLGMYYVAGFGVLASVFGKFQRRERLGILVGALSLYLFFSGLNSVNSRWQAPLVRSFIDRVFVEPSKRDYFLQAGMPSLTENGFESWQSEQDRSRFSDTPVFRAWMTRSAKSTLIRYWISHPIETVSEVFRRESVFQLFNSGTYTAAQVEISGFYKRVSDWIFYPRGVFLYAWLVLALMMTGIAWRTVGLGVPFVIFALCPLIAFLVWQGCSIEIERHSIILKTQLRLSIVLMILLSLEKAHERIQKTI